MSNICSFSMENTHNNVEFGVLQKTSKQSLILIFFQIGRGETPLPYPPPARHFVYTNSTPPPTQNVLDPPLTGELYEISSGVVLDNWTFITPPPPLRISTEANLVFYSSLWSRIVLRLHDYLGVCLSILTNSVNQATLLPRPPELRGIVLTLSVCIYVCLWVRPMKISMCNISVI